MPRAFQINYFKDLFILSNELKFSLKDKPNLKKKYIYIFRSQVPKLFYQVQQAKLANKKLKDQLVVFIAQQVKESYRKK